MSIKQLNYIILLSLVVLLKIKNNEIHFVWHLLLLFYFIFFFSGERLIPCSWGIPHRFPSFKHFIYLFYCIFNSFEKLVSVEELWVNINCLTSTALFFRTYWLAKFVLTYLSWLHWLMRWDEQANWHFGFVYTINCNPVPVKFVTHFE